MPPKRMTANPVRPSRHRAGKPTGASSSSESESEGGSDAEEAVQQEKQAGRKIAPPPKVPSAGKIASSLGKVDLAARRRQGQEAEERRLAAEKAARLAAEEGFVTEESDAEEGQSDSEGESDDDDEEDEEESSEEEEEAPRRLMIKPKFVPKSQRNGGGDKSTKQAASSSREKEEEEEARLIEEEARRKQAMDDMVEEQMRKDAAARAAGKKHWDDVVDSEDDVDTDDDTDPEAEYAAWKLRELRRIKREREAIEAREKEREEVERRRNLTEEERKAEDEAHLAKQKDEKDARGKMSYMQKYFHKGAFYQNDETAEGLAKRDIMGTRFADDIKNRELLPKSLQMRDMTKLGRKGASKYKDLRSEDTGRWGQEIRDSTRRGGGDFDGYNVDDRFKSDRERERSGPGGANAIPLGDRKSAAAAAPANAPEGPRNPGRPRHDGDDRYRERDGSRGGDGGAQRNNYRPSQEGPSRDTRRGNRSRSRSPRRRRDRDEDDYGRRKRESSREVDRYESDKRRKIDSQ